MKIALIILACLVGCALVVAFALALLSGNGRDDDEE